MPYTTRSQYAEFNPLLYVRIVVSPDVHKFCTGGKTQSMFPFDCKSHRQFRTRVSLHQQNFTHRVGPPIIYSILKNCIICNAGEIFSYHSFPCAMLKSVLVKPIKPTAIGVHMSPHPIYLSLWISSRPAHKAMFGTGSQLSCLISLLAPSTRHFVA